jgi:putative ABC transport system substrate-binding protein
MVLVLTALRLPLTAIAQQPGQVPRIAFLGLNFPPSAAAPSLYLEAFRDGLRERGWVEGNTIAIEWRWAEGSRDRFAALAAELIQLPVNVLVVENTTTGLMAKQVTTTLPIVVGGGGSMLESGLIASLARPGGNVTGVHTMGPEINAKKLELLKEVLPTVTRVAVLRGHLTYRHELPVMEKAAQALGMALHLVTVSDPTAQEIKRPSGDVEYLIACGASLGWNICYERANKVCPSGYTTRSEQAGFNRKELRIACPTAKPRDK